MEQEWGLFWVQGSGSPSLQVPQAYAQQSYRAQLLLALGATVSKAHGACLQGTSHLAGTDRLPWAQMPTT